MATSAPAPADAALVVELDPLLLGGFALSDEVLTERLKKYGVVDDDPFRFARRIYGQPFAEALGALVPKGVDQAHVERRLTATYTALLQQHAQQSRAAIRAMLRPLAKAGIRLAAITHLRADIVSELCEGIPGEVLPILDPTPVSVGLSHAMLQSAIVALGMPVRQCFALTACGVSVRAALRVGLRAAIIPDPMVAFENCAGADFIADKPDRAFWTRLKARLGA